MSGKSIQSESHLSRRSLVSLKAHYSLPADAVSPRDKYRKVPSDSWIGSKFKLMQTCRETFSFATFPGTCVFGDTFPLLARSYICFGSWLFSNCCIVTHELAWPARKSLYLKHYPRRNFSYASHSQSSRFYCCYSKFRIVTRSYAQLSSISNGELSIYAYNLLNTIIKMLISNTWHAFFTHKILECVEVSVPIRVRVRIRVHVRKNSLSTHFSSCEDYHVHKFSCKVC